MGAVIIYGAPLEKGQCDPRRGYIASALGAHHIRICLQMTEVREALEYLDPVIFTALHPALLRDLKDPDGVTAWLISWPQALARAGLTKDAPETKDVGSSPPLCDGERHGQEADFWIIWSPEGERPPSYQHSSRESADREADRLALANPGCRFFVMEPRLEVTASRPVRIQYSTPDEVPF